jgi:xanthine dehydrogenase accessory factor
MKEILGDLDRWQQHAEEVALATVVGRRGSTPRPLGARLAVTRSGRLAGSVSGGCVEGDVVLRAMQVLDSGRPVVATYGIADEIGFEVGLSCGGAIDVLIEPFTWDSPWSAVRGAIETEEPAAMAIGVAPAALLGRRLAVRGGTNVGSIDPALDPTLVTMALARLRAGGARVVTLERRGETVRVLLETFPPPRRLVIVGATPTAVALCRLAKTLGFRVTVIDARGTFATRERFSDADELVVDWPDAVLAGCRLDAYASVVVLTHDPKFDHPCLMRVLRSGAGYIGAIGSHGTHQRRTEALRGEGFTDEELDRIRAPIGLDIGAQSPEEIALAILAEVLAVRSGRDGRALKYRDAPINAD